MNRTGWTTSLAGGTAASLLVVFGIVHGFDGGAPPDDTRPEKLPSRVTLRVAAGSELDDVLCAGGTSHADESTRTPVTCRPSHLVTRLRQETNVDLKAEFIGTLEAADTIDTDPHAYDAAWFASDDYLRLVLQARGAPRPMSSRPLMRSPVVLGVKHDVATRLGWTNTPVSWKQIAARAKDGSLGFLMTNPSSSNSGLSTLLGAATAFDPNKPFQSEDTGQVAGQVKDLFKGQLGRAASSGWLSDMFRKNPAGYDAIFNYESEVLALAKELDLTVIYPSDGTTEATYPLTLLNRTKQRAYDTAVRWLLTKDVQRELSATSRRRPGRTDVKPPPGVPDNPVTPVPLPEDLATIDELIFTYFDEFAPKTRTTYLLDTSDSMDEFKLNQLRRAFEGLAGDDTTISGQFKRFRKGEQLTVYTYATKVKRMDSIVIGAKPQTDPRLQALVDKVGTLAGDGRTAYYDAIDAAYADMKAHPGDEGATRSIVLMTDGQLNGGQTYAKFIKKYDATYRSLHVPTYVILVGDAAGSTEPSLTQLVRFAKHTGGHDVAAADAADLSKLFQEIRDYQ